MNVYLKPSLHPSVFPAVKYALLCYRALKIDKIKTLEICKGEFNCHHHISDDAKDYIK